MMAKIAIIGGTGLYDIEGLHIKEQFAIDTPFGAPSAELRRGEFEGQEVLFLPRHGEGHRLLPTEINFRANIYALKTLGVEQVIAVSAVGSMKEELAPRHFVVPEQLYDNTRKRVTTFFGDGIAAHISMAHPFCERLSTHLYTAAQAGGTTVHRGGTYICMEGPAFSSLAESQLYRQLGFDIIGMTAATEAKLAREAEMCYALLACVTDYDCWHPDHDKVTTDAILNCLRANSANARRIVGLALPQVAQQQRHCTCATALQTAIATAPQHITAAAKQRLQVLIGSYVD